MNTQLSKIITPRLIFFVSLCVFLILQNTYEFTGFESRFGLFAQEMLRNGVTFFPTTYGHFYPDYPATSTILTYWLTFLFSKHILVLTAVLPTAITSALTVMFVYLIGSSYNKYWGICAVLFCFLTYAFVEAARTIALDQFTTTATTACFYCVLSATYYNKPRHLYWLPLAWILGFAFRGPIGLIIPATVVGGFYFLEKDWRKLIFTIVSSVSLLLLCLILLLIAASIDGGHDLVKEVIAMQITERVSNQINTPFYFYLTSGLVNYALTFPIAIVVIAILAKPLFTWQTPASQPLTLLRHLLLWTLIVLIGMSIPMAKKIRYLLPITPALSLIAASIFIPATQIAALDKLRKIIVRICSLLPLIGLLAIAACLIYQQTKHIHLEMYPITSACLLLILGLIPGIVSKKYSVEKMRIIFLAVGAASFLALTIGMIEPINLGFNRAIPFVKQVETLRGNKSLVLYQIGPDGDDIKYMVAADKAITPVFFNTTDQLVNYQQPAIFVTEQKIFAKLPADIQEKFNIVIIGHLGHTKCVAFVKK